MDAQPYNQWKGEVRAPWKAEEVFGDHVKTFLHQLTLCCQSQGSAPALSLELKLPQAPLRPFGLRNTPNLRVGFFDASPPPKKDIFGRVQLQGSIARPLALSQPAPFSPVSL